MIRLVNRNDVDPVCPHCEKTLEVIWFRELSGVLGRRYLYFCAECKKSLGISHRKGLLMG